jgi:HemY protein
MVYRLIFFIGLLVLLGASYLVYLNPTEATVVLAHGVKINGSMPFFLLVAVALGGFGAGVFFTLVALKQQVASFFRSRREKRMLAAQQALLEGIKAGFKGETKKAVACLNKVLKIDQRNVEATLALVRLYLREGQPRQALKIIDAGLSHNPEDPRLHWYKIQVLQELDDPLRMTNQLLYMKARYPHNRALMKMLVEQFSSRGYWREALEVWQELARIEPRGSEARQKAIQGIANCAYEQARRQWLAGNRDEARESLKLVFEYAKGHIAAWLLKAEMEEKPADALSDLRSGFSKSPNSIFLLEGERLLTADDQENSVPRILKLYRKVLSRNSDYHPARWLYARFCLEHQKIAEAEAAARKLREDGFTGPLLEVLLGELVCRKEHRLEEAIDHFKRALGCAERLEPVFACGSCGRLSPDWKYRCPHCATYNSYDISERVCSFG